MFCFVSHGETKPEKRSNFPKAAEKVSSLIEVRTKENLMSRAPAIPHPFINLESEMAWKTWPQGRKEYITGDRHNLPAFAVHAFISEGVTEWTAIPEL